MKYVSAFGAFWFDFLVGDSWEILIGVLGLLGLARLVDLYGPNPDTVLTFAVPLGVLVVLGLSLWRAER